MSNNKEWDKPIVNICPNYLINYFRQNNIIILDEEKFVSELISRCNILTWELAKNIVIEQHNSRVTYTINKVKMESNEQKKNITRLVDTLINKKDNVIVKKYDVTDER